MESTLRVILLTWLDVDFSPRRSDFIPRAELAAFVAEKVALGQILCPIITCLYVAIFTKPTIRIHLPPGPVQ